MTPSPPARTEDEIRDHLAANLDLIEPGLRLVGKEKLLRNDKGAQGFVDIFARSATGQFVVIEVKRTNVAARQAIQEIVKYVALLKQNLLVKATEVRLAVASTEWHELIVPFSEFVRAAPYRCEGLHILLGPDGLPTTVERIELAPEERARHLSRRHFIWGFRSEDDARAAMRILAVHMRDVGLTDFVVLMVAIRASDNPAHRFLYFAQQELMLDAYMALIRKRFSPEQVEEFEAWLEDCPELEDKVGEAADKVWEDISLDEGGLYTQLNANHAQIAHPEKARYWFDPAALVSVEIFRFGRFEDPYIADETIIGEITAEQGGSLHHGHIAADLSSKPEVEALLRVADEIFFYNQVWRVAAHELCEYATRTGASSVRLKAFSNDDILRTVAGLYIGHTGYAPTFEFEIEREDRSETFFGTIEWKGNLPNFDHLIAEHFEGDRFQYFLLRHFGAQRSINSDLMDEMGLVYVLARHEEEKLVPIRVQGATIHEIRGGERKFLSDFLEANDEFISGIVEIFLEHEQEFGQLYAHAAFLFAEHQLEASKSPETKARGVYWSGEVDRCDICKRDLSTARFMVDTSVKGGPWACMCALCCAQVGGAIKWGYGQLYERDEQGWRLVGGDGPSEDDDELD